MEDRDFIFSVKEPIMSGLRVRRSQDLRIPGNLEFK